MPIDDQSLVFGDILKPLFTNKYIQKSNIRAVSHNVSHAGIMRSIALNLNHVGCNLNLFLKQYSMCLNNGCYFFILINITIFGRETLVLLGLAQLVQLWLLAELIDVLYINDLLLSPKHYMCVRHVTNENRSELELFIISTTKYSARF